MFDKEFDKEFDKDFDKDFDKEHDKDKDKECGKKEKCPTFVHKDVDVCVPVAIKAFAKVGDIETKCIGEPDVDYKDYCPGKPKAVCKFTISQKIRVKVPVIFAADAEVGEASVDCDGKKEKGEEYGSYYTK